mmetsp:Transcript_50610/g.122133  ORF Transcript_50610/g.122133 Transcript_50610/m.122133 type:complete len:83 (+) Transcript_50610:99-347(+)
MGGKDDRLLSRGRNNNTTKSTTARGVRLITSACIWVQTRSPICPPNKKRLHKETMKQNTNRSNQQQETLDTMSLRSSSGYDR